jgi:two-component system response regulator CpxR
VLRRAGSTPTPPEVLELGDVRLDLGGREARLGGAPIPLTGVEMAVLEALLRSAGRVVTRDELSRAALLRPASALDRSLDMHLSNLRRKLGPLPGGSERIKTIRAVGYQYVRPAEQG